MANHNKKVLNFEIGKFLLDLAKLVFAPTLIGSFYSSKFLDAKLFLFSLLLFFLFIIFGLRFINISNNE